MSNQIPTGYEPNNLSGGTNTKRNKPKEGTGISNKQLKALKNYILQEQQKLLATHQSGTSMTSAVPEHNASATLTGLFQQLIEKWVSKVLIRRRNPRFPDPP